MITHAKWICFVFFASTVSTTLQEERYRMVFIQDLFDDSEQATTSKRFDAEQFGKVSHFTTHAASNSLFVAINNSVLRLQLDTFAEVDKVTWSLSTKQTEECRRAATDQAWKGKCQQYSVSLLHPMEDALPPETEWDLRAGLLVCLTNQVYAECSIRQISDLSAPAIISWKGAQHCPFSAKVPVSATRASDRSLFIGGKFDEDPVSKAAILRLTLDSMQSENRFPPRTAARLNWIVQDEKSVFVSSFEFHSAVYFIFRETANEAVENCRTEPVVSRIGRVCLSDRGLKTGRLQSFLKTSLICPSVAVADGPDNRGLVHTHVQSVYLDQAGKRLFAAFSTPDGDFPSSAVCEYSFNEIEAVFDGPFFDARGIPTKFTNHMQILRQSYSKLVIDEELLSATIATTHRLLTENWTSLAIDWVPVSPKADDNLILFTTSSKGVLYKWHHFKSTTCLVEQINLKQAFERECSSGESYRVHLARGTGNSANQQPTGLPHILVSTSERIFRIPVARCDRLGNQKSTCELLSDPYCIWNGNKSACEEVTPGIILRRQLRHPEIYTTFESCPVVQQKDGEVQPLKNVNVHGSWGVWSPWTSCGDSQQIRSGFSSQYGLSVSDCQCRHRSCSSPFSYGNDGQSCPNGSSIQLRGCSLPGGWTDWTPWFACEPHCQNVHDPAVSVTQTRRRWCTNPRPQGAGEECKGLGKMSRPCPYKIPTCSGRIVSLPTWSAWSPWSNCSTACGGGHRIRWRRCQLGDNTGPPSALTLNRTGAVSVKEGNSSACLGNAYDVQTCNTSNCPVTKVISAWTSWYVTEGSQQTGSKQRRFRVECIAEVADADQLHARAKFEQSICSTNAVGRSVCRTLAEPADASQWLSPMDESTWSAWSECTRACGQGKRYRWRKNKRLSGRLAPDTEAMDREEDGCNTHACPGYWSCWSEWSACEEQENNCEKGRWHRGQQQRKRTCLVPVSIKPREGQNLDASQCDGGIEASQQARTCEATSMVDATCHNQRQTSRFKRFAEGADWWINPALNQTRIKIDKRDAAPKSGPVLTPWAEWSRCFSVVDLSYKVRIRVREFCEGCDLREVKRCDTDEYVTVGPKNNSMNAKDRQTLYEYLSVKRHSLLQLVLAGVFASIFGISAVVIPYLVCTLCRQKRKQHPNSSADELLRERLLTSAKAGGQKNRPYIWFADNDSNVDDKSPQVVAKLTQDDINSNQPSGHANRTNVSAPLRYSSLTRIQALHNDHIRQPNRQRNTPFAQTNLLPASPWHSIAEEVPHQPDTLSQTPAQYNEYEQETLALLMPNDRAFQPYNSWGRPGGKGNSP